MFSLCGKTCTSRAVQDVSKRWEDWRSENFNNCEVLQRQAIVDQVEVKRIESSKLAGGHGLHQGALAVIDGERCGQRAAYSTEQFTKDEGKAVGPTITILLD